MPILRKMNCWLKSEYIVILLYGKLSVNCFITTGRPQVQRCPDSVALPHQHRSNGATLPNQHRCCRTSAS